MGRYAKSGLHRRYHFRAGRLILIKTPPLRGGNCGIWIPHLLSIFLVVCSVGGRQTVNLLASAKVGSIPTPSTLTHWCKLHSVHRRREVKTPLMRPFQRVGRAVYCGGVLHLCSLKTTVGSNPSPSISLTIEEYYAIININGKQKQKAKK